MADDALADLFAGLEELRDEHAVRTAELGQAMRQRVTALTSLADVLRARATTCTSKRLAFTMARVASSVSKVAAAREEECAVVEAQSQPLVSLVAAEQRLLPEREAGNGRLPVACLLAH